MPEARPLAVGVTPITADGPAVHELNSSPDPYECDSQLCKPYLAKMQSLALAKLGQYDLAYDAYTRGMDSAKAYNNLGVAFLEERQYARASRCFEKAIDTQLTFYEKAKENLSLSNRMLHKFPMIQQQTLIRQEPACL